MLSEAKSQLTRHGPGERDAEGLPAGRVRRGEEWVTLRNRDGVAFRVDCQLGVAVFAHQDGVAESSDKKVKFGKVELF